MFVTHGTCHLSGSDSVFTSKHHWCGVNCDSGAIDVAAPIHRKDKASSNVARGKYGLARVEGGLFC